MRHYSKYGAKKIELDGRVFHSKKEATRYAELQLMQKANRIADLACQAEFRLTVNNQLICKYYADFIYKQDGELVVEDVKSEPTRKLPAYRIKNKLMKAIYGIEIKEV